MQTLTAEYLEGIREGRATFREHGVSVAADALDTLNALCRRFDALSPVGQMYRGERDFWKAKIRNA